MNKVPRETMFSKGCERVKGTLAGVEGGVVVIPVLIFVDRAVTFEQSGGGASAPRAYLNDHGAGLLRRQLPRETERGGMTPTSSITQLIQL